MIPNLENDYWQGVIKFLISATPALGIYIALKVKYGKVKFLSALVSGLIGVAFAWLLDSPIRHYFNDAWYTPLIAVLAITGRDIAYWIIFKFNINLVLDKIQEILFGWFQRKLGKWLK